MKKLFALLLVIGLAGCGSLLPKGAPPPQVFTINAPQFAQNPNAPLPYAIEIAQPAVWPGLNTDRIALKTGNNTIDYFADSRWGGEIGNLAQAALIDAFDRSAVFKSASSDLSTVKSDYSLALEIRDFQADYSNRASAPTVHIRMNATLIDARTKMVVVSKTYEETEPATANNLAPIMLAFDTAFQKMSFSIIHDTAQALSK